MKRMTRTALAFFLGAAGVAFAETPSEQRERIIREIPAPADAPSSAGVNQGFSRKPHPARWDAATRTLTIEGTLPTIMRLKQGNNSRFVIAQWRISPDGKKMAAVSRQIFEGNSDKGFCNVCTGELPAVAPGVFYDGGWNLVIFEFNRNTGELLRCSFQRISQDSGIPNSHTLLYPAAQTGSPGMMPLIYALYH